MVHTTSDNDDAPSITDRTGQARPALDLSIENPDGSTIEMTVGEHGDHLRIDTYDMDGNAGDTVLVPMAVATWQFDEDAAGLPENAHEYGAGAEPDWEMVREYDSMVDAYRDGGMVAARDYQLHHYVHD